MKHRPDVKLPAGCLDPFACRTEKEAWLIDSFLCILSIASKGTLFSEADTLKTFIDVFAGCGGLSLGLLQAGFQGRFAIEHDKFAFATLQANLLSNHAIYRFKWPRWLPKAPIDVGEFLVKYGSHLEGLAGKVDLLAGGPPCQGFSTAGRRRCEDPRNQLFASYLELVEIVRPNCVLIENVRGFTMDFDSDTGAKNYSQKLRHRLASNYEVFEELLDLSKFGVPQLRTRYFLIALRPHITTTNPFDLLRNRLPSFLRSMRLNTPVTSSAAISDLEVSKNGMQPSIEDPGFYEIRPSNPLTRFQKLMHEGSNVLGDLRLARHSDHVASRFREIIEISHAEGRLNTTISEEMRSQFGLKKRALRVLDPDRPAPTITSMPDDLLHYHEPRTLTVRENARLQGFPDWFSFRGKYTTGGLLRRTEVPRFTQVANAVPPLVAKAIGEMLIDLLR